jgi:hypothetical protein
MRLLSDLMDDAQSIGQGAVADEIGKVLSDYRAFSNSLFLLTQAWRGQSFSPGCGSTP